MDIGQIDDTNEDNEDFDALQHRQRQRSSQKPKRVSQRAPGLSPPSCRSVIDSASVNTARQEIGNDETKQNEVRKKRLVCYRYGNKGHSARLCLFTDECQDVDEVATEPPSDANSDLLGPPNCVYRE